MSQPDLSELTVSQIMLRWPATIEVFLDLDMHCVGCLIGVFQRLEDAAAEHGIATDLLRARIEAAIAGGDGPSGPVPVLRRSVPDGEHPSRGASDVRPRQGLRLPKR